MIIDGIYNDPNYYQAGTFAGLRAVVTGIGTSAYTDLFLIGSDDGEVFYALNGAFDKDGEVFRVDFSPNGGPGALVANYANGVITWENNSTWIRMPNQACADQFDLNSNDQSDQSANTAIGGVFMSSTSRGWDSVRFVTNTFNGTVLDQLLVIGSNNGRDFWFQYGSLNQENTAVTFDVAAIDGRASVTCDVEALRIRCPLDSVFGTDWVKTAVPCGSSSNSTVV